MKHQEWYSYCMATYEDFTKLDIRVGKVIDVQDFPEARTPAYKLRIDFGKEIGVKKSSAQVTDHYTKEELMNKLVIAVTNFPPRQIGPFMSEVLTLGLPDENDNVVLLSPDQNVPLGGKLYQLAVFCFLRLSTRAVVTIAAPISTTLNALIPVSASSDGELLEFVDAPRTTLIVPLAQS